MKIVVFGDDHRVGALVDDQIIDLSLAYERARSRKGAAAGALPSDLSGLISAGSDGIAKAEEAVAFAREEASGEEAPFIFAADGTALHAPWARRRIACCGGNFGVHHAAMNNNRPGAVPLAVEDATRQIREDGPWGFWKVPDEVVGPEGSVRMPRRTTHFDYEGESAIVIGARGRDIAAEDLDTYVWGVVLLIDWSIRDDPRSPRSMSYVQMKNFDDCTSMGPCIAVNEVDCGAVEVETRVNGELRQKYSTAEAAFSFGETLADVSRDLSLVPGDVVSLGTGAGTAADSTPRAPDGSVPTDLFLKPGDCVEVSSPSIGSFRNFIVAP